MGSRATPLSDTDKQRLAISRRAVKEADEHASLARAEQNEVWRYLLGKGCAGTAIADESGVTATAIRFRIGEPVPSRTNRGKNPRRG